MNCAIFLISGCVYAMAQAKAPEPKFYKGQQVKYEVGFFLHKVCSGKGEISDVNSNGLGSFIYQINPPMGESDCPSIIERDEKDIKASNEK